MFASRVAVFTVSFAFLGSTTVASALDLTGSWEGVEICKSFLAGAEVKTKTDVTVQITQTGSNLNWSKTGGELSGNSSGFAFADAQDALKGAAGLIVCGASQIYGTTTSLKAKTTPDGGGSLKGTEIGAGQGGVATCKLALKRVLTTDPMVAFCP